MTSGTLIGFALLAVVIVGVFALYLLREVATDLAKAEVRAWLPHLSRGIVRRAAQALPEEQREILEAWEAEVQEYTERPLTMLLVAARIARDRKFVARELEKGALEAESAGEGVMRQRSLRVPVVTAMGVVASTAIRTVEASFVRINNALLSAGRRVGPATRRNVTTVVMVSSIGAMAAQSVTMLMFHGASTLSLATAVMLVIMLVMFFSRRRFLP